MASKLPGLIEQLRQDIAEFESRWLGAEHVAKSALIEDRARLLQSNLEKILRNRA